MSLRRALSGSALRDVPASPLSIGLLLFAVGALLAAILLPRGSDVAGPDLATWLLVSAFTATGILALSRWRDGCIHRGVTRGRTTIQGALVLLIVLWLVGVIAVAITGASMGGDMRRLAIWSSIAFTAACFVPMWWWTRHAVPAPPAGGA